MSVHAGLRCCLALGLVLLTAAPAAAQTQVANTVHNLTPGGPGQLKESRPSGLCSFCHTPHNASPSRALWNRDLAPVTYQLYASSTLQATLDQPTGSSRLCLSCHDGILAMGTLRVPPPGEALSLGAMTGPAALGTDLSDDHPVSFTYDAALAVRRGELVDPATLPRTVRLDPGGQLQCTSCHDPHEDRRRKFLRTANTGGALCLSCHRPNGWTGSAHEASMATWNGVGTSPWPAGAEATVSANACLNCHRSHSAGHGPRLLARAVEPDNCSTCHDGTVASRSIAAQFTDPSRFSRHPIEVAQWTHDPRENPAAMPRHVACADCHNAHAADASPAQPPAVTGRLKGVSGISIDGTPLRQATHEYEVCNKCHGFGEPATLGIVRADATRIVREKINPANRSFHPIAATGRNATIAGLRQGYTAASIIRCSDCHGADGVTAGGTTPRGPHASRYAPILARQYVTADPTPESFASYDLCYQCHDRATLLGPASAFPHREHVVEHDTSCAVCHDAHGSRQNPHLINFMLRDANGRVVVSADGAGRLEYVPTSAGRGTCYLNCHGVEHSPESYPGG